MTMTIVAKAKTQVSDDIPMTRISPASYTEGDTVQKIQSSGSNQQQRNTYGDYQPNFNNRQFIDN